MNQRVIIALALFLEPSFVIADEPTTALDVIMQDNVFKFLDKVQEVTGTSMLLITHDISLVFESCESMAIMHGGQVAETGSVVDIYDNPIHPYSILLQDAFPDVRYPDTDLEVIGGVPPTNHGEVNHCTFQERCPLKVSECNHLSPDLETPDGSADHRVGCHRAEEIAAADNPRKFVGGDDE